MGLVLASEFTDLFNRLEQVRKNQIARGDIADNALGSTITSPVAIGTITDTPNQPQALKNAINQLTPGTGISATFANNIAIPAVGDLLLASHLSNWQAQVAAVEKVPATCSFCPSDFSHNGSDFGNDGHNGNDFSWNFSECWSDFGNYTRNF